MSHERFDPQIERLADLFGRIAGLMLDSVLQFVRGEATMAQTRSTLAALVDALTQLVTQWTTDVLPAIYQDGIEQAQTSLQTSEDAPQSTDERMATPEHRAMLELAQRGVERDLSATTAQMQRDAETALEEVTRRNLEAMMSQGRNAIPQAREMEAEMRERGIAFTDRRGRRWKPRDYARMVLRTQSVEASNSANLTTAGQLGSPGVRVSDGGPGDVDEPCKLANRQVWSIGYATLHKLEHPNCRRSFAPLPSTYSGEFEDGREHLAPTMAAAGGPSELLPYAGSKDYGDPGVYTSDSTRLTEPQKKAAMDEARRTAAFLSDEFPDLENRWNGRLGLFDDEDMGGAMGTATPNGEVRVWDQLMGFSSDASEARGRHTLLHEMLHMFSAGYGMEAGRFYRRNPGWEEAVVEENARILFRDFVGDDYERLEAYHRNSNRSNPYNRYIEALDGFRERWSLGDHDAFFRDMLAVPPQKRANYLKDRGKRMDLTGKERKRYTEDVRALQQDMNYRRMMER